MISPLFEQLDKLNSILHFYSTKTVLSSSAIYKIVSQKHMADSGDDTMSKSYDAQTITIPPTATSDKNKSSCCSV